MIVKRGEIWYAELNPIQGSEQAGTRPVLLVQNDAINKFTTTVLAVPLTTNLRRAALPSCVLITAGDGGMVSDSVALCHQMRSLDKSRLRDKLGDVSEQTMAKIESCLLFTLNIS